LTWESRYLAAKASGIKGVLGTLGSSANVSAVEEPKPGSSGILPWLTKASSRSSEYVEQRFVAKSAGGVAKLTALASRVSEFFERDVIGQIQGVIGIATGSAAIISSWVEYNVFESGVNSGVSQTSSLLGRVLYKLERILGHPLVVGTTVLIAIFGLLWGVVS